MLAYEVWHRNRTLCMMQKMSKLTIQCQRIDDANVNWTLPVSAFNSPHQSESGSNIWP